jgi:outer membrane immunogenic protein
MKNPLLGASMLVAVIISAQALVPVKAMAAEDNLSTSVRKAYAADRPVYKAVPYVQPAASTSWSGFYVGLNAGAREDQVSATTTSVVGFAAGFPLFPLAGFPTPSLSQSAWSFRIGPYVGYNWQIGSQWLVGVE